LQALAARASVSWSGLGPPGAGADGGLSHGVINRVAQQGDDRKRDTVRAAMLLAIDFDPIVLLQRWKDGVALARQIDLGEDDPFAAGKGGRVDLRTPDDEEFVKIASMGDGLVQAGDPKRAFGRPAGVATEDKITPIGQRSADRLPSPSAHQHRLAGGQLAK